LRIEEELGDRAVYVGELGDHTHLIPFSRIVVTFIFVVTINKAVLKCIKAIVALRSLRDFTWPYSSLPFKTLQVSYSTALEDPVGRLLCDSQREEQKMIQVDIRQPRSHDGEHTQIDQIDQIDNSCS
jgi:hypothetical protein